MASDCTNCAGSGIEPNIGGLCVRCSGTGARRPGSHRETPSRAQTIHCLCGFVIESVFGCPARWGQRCPPRHARDLP